MSNGQMPMINVGGNLPPEILQQQQALNRQQQMAQLLMQQGQSMPSGQMVSGRYVAPSFFQYAAPLAQMYAGTRLAEKGDKAMLDLAEQLRKGKEQETRAIMEQLKPRDVQTEMAGPYTGNVPMPTATQTLPPDFQAATNLALQSRFGAGKELLPTLINRALPEPIKPTTEMQNYEYAKSQGYKGTLNDFRNQITPYQQAQLKLDREKFAFEQSKEGTKPLTETQSNSVAFGARAVESNRLATDLENRGFTNIGKTRTVAGGIVGTAPIVGEKLEQGIKSAFNVLPEFVGGPSPEQQQVDQARRNFITAVLRKESGAVISPKEYSDEERKYFPQLGDSQEVIKQKQDARKLGIQALEAQAGPQGAKQISQIANAQLKTQDQEALAWANANPNDPRSAQIKQRLGR
jgi:hypothetical protein